MKSTTLRQDGQRQQILAPHPVLLGHVRGIQPMVADNGLTQQLFQ